MKGVERQRQTVRQRMDKPRKNWQEHSRMKREMVCVCENSNSTTLFYKDCSLGLVNT